MKLHYTIICSIALHMIVLGFAMLSPEEQMVDASIEGWEQVQIKPVTFKTITRIAPKKIEKKEVIKKVEAPELAAKKVEKPKKIKKPVKKKKVQVARKIIKKKKIEQVTPKPPVKKVVSVVASKDASAKKVVTQVANTIQKPEKIDGQLAVARPTEPTKEVGASNAPKALPQSQGRPTMATASGNGVDVNGLIQGYNRSVYRTVNKHKNYPMIARRMRLQGKVYIEIMIDAQGNIKMARVKHSSGHTVLDKEALKTIKRIKRLPSPPTALGWSSRRLTIPLVYKFS